MKISSIMFLQSFGLLILMASGAANGQTESEVAACERAGEDAGTEILTIATNQHTLALETIQANLSQALETCLGDLNCRDFATAEAVQAENELQAAYANFVLNELPIFVLAVIDDCLQNLHNYYADPIVFDLAGNGFSFSSLEQDPIRFDIDGDNTLELTAWTNLGEDDAFLALDLNDNNSVDGGSELFGTGTKLLSGEFAQHGFEALNELDTPLFGGNGDGIMDKRDFYFKKLVLWTDLNHDGVSNNQEIKRLIPYGIRAIGLSYNATLSMDEFSNIIAFEGFALQTHGHQEVLVPIVDVYLRSSGL